MKIIALEEHFVVPELMDAWQDGPDKTEEDSGNRQLKRAMFLSAFACMNTDPASCTDYNKLSTSGMPGFYAQRRRARQSQDGWREDRVPLGSESQIVAAEVAIVAADADAAGGLATPHSRTVWPAAEARVLPSGLNANDRTPPV